MHIFMKYTMLINMLGQIVIDWPNSGYFFLWSFFVAQIGFLCGQSSDIKISVGFPGHSILELVGRSSEFSLS